LNDETTKSELLFYLVTGGMANLVCRSRGVEFALEFQKGGFCPGWTGTEVTFCRPTSAV